MSKKFLYLNFKITRIPLTNLIEKEFEHWFKIYFVPLTNFINSYLNNIEDSKEIVQSTFMKIWSSRHHLSIEGSIKSYLFQASKNTMLDYIRQNKKHNVGKELVGKDHEGLTLEETREMDPLLVRYTISMAARQLKPKTLQIFNLWSQDGLTYDEISEYLKISKRTVEYNMGVATEFLRNKLNKFEIGFDD